MPHDKKPQKLGRGLSALFNTQDTVTIPLDTLTPKTSTEIPKAHPVTRMIQTIPIEHIKPSPFQPRQHFRVEEIEELAASIQKNGLLQPIICRKNKENIYEIVAGERRWRAMKQLGYKDVPVIERAYSDKEVMAAALVENIQRANLNAIEEAEGYKQLIDIKYTQEDIAKVVGKSRSHVANLLRLLQLPEVVKKEIRFGRLSGGHAKILVGLDEAQLQEIIETLISQKLSVRQTEQLIRKIRKKGHNASQDAIRKEGHTSSGIAAGASDDIAQLTQLIQAKVKTPVHLTVNKDQINLTLTFKNYETLDQFLSQMSLI